MTAPSRVERVRPGTEKEPSSPAGSVGTRASDRAAGSRPVTEAARPDEKVELTPANPEPWRPQEPADVLGLHLLTAYPENGSAADQQSWEAATGGGWLTEAGALNGMSNPNDPAAMRRREQLFATMLQAQQEGRQINMRLDYDWGRNVPDTPEGRAEYARLVGDFIQEARARGVDLSKVNFVLGNEPNLALENQGHGMSPEDYVAAVRSVRAELETRGLDARLASAGLSPGGSDMGQYLSRMLQAGLGDLVDVYAMHEYQDSLQNIDHLNQIASSFGQAKPIEITEFGIPRGGNLNAQKQAAAYQSFIQRVMDWNGDSSRPPIQSVTLWIHNRGSGQEGYLVSPEMLNGMNQLSQSKYHGSGTVDLGPAPAPSGGGGPAATSSSSRHHRSRLSEDDLLVLAMTALQELQLLGAPGRAACELMRRSAELDLQHLSPVTRTLLARLQTLLGSSLASV